MLPEQINSGFNIFKGGSFKSSTINDITVSESFTKATHVLDQEKINNFKLLNF